MTKEMTIKYVRTGEFRTPNEGDWFLDSSGNPVQARFNFACIDLAIVRQVIEEMKP